MAYADDIAQIQRRRQMAQALIQQGGQPQGMQAGKFFVGPTPFSGLAGLASIVAGGVMDRRLEKKEKGLTEGRQKQLAEILSGITGGGSPPSAPPPQPTQMANQPVDGGSIPSKPPLQSAQAATMANAQSSPPSADPQRASMLQFLQGLPVAQQEALVGQQAMAKLFPKAEEDYTLKPGEARMRGNKQIASLPGGGEKQPSSVQEYEYAKAQGFKGSFQDWIAAGGQSSRPSAITVFEYFSKLPPDQQQRMLETMRAPVVRDVGGIPTVVQGQGTLNPLSTLEKEASAAGRLAEGKAVGQATGEAKGGLAKKGVSAQSNLDTLDIAEPLIDIATGSVTGAAADKVASWFGGALDGAKATAQLKILQANLMMNMPRMEGPQSDKDVQNYREAAGQLGDPTVPRDIKKASIQTIRTIQNKYAEGISGKTSTAGSPRKINSDAEFDALPSGTLFVGPDGQTRRKP